MGSIRRLPNIPASRAVVWNASLYETASSLQQVAQEQIVEVTVRAFNHFSTMHRSADSECGQRLARELMAYMSPLFERRSENARFALGVLLSQYRYYCHKVREWTLLDITIERLVKHIGFHSGSYCEEAESIKALVERRALMTLIAGPSTEPDVILQG